MPLPSWPAFHSSWPFHSPIPRTARLLVRATTGGCTTNPLTRPQSPSRYRDSFVANCMYQSLPPAALQLRWTLADTDKDILCIAGYFYTNHYLSASGYRSIRRFACRLGAEKGLHRVPGLLTIPREHVHWSQSRRDDCSGFHLIHLLAFVRLCAVNSSPPV